MVRPFFWFMFLLLLTGMLMLPVRAQQFKAPGTICVQAGGSIDPQTALIQCSRDYHVLTESIIADVDGIRINTSNIVPGGGKDPAITGFPISFGLTSYIVSVNGSAYSLTNSTTGQILEQSSNASQIFNDAYGNLTGGGTVYVSPGLYSLNGTIYPTSNTITSGEGESSVLSLSNTTAQPIMVLNNVQNVKILYLKLTHNFPIVWGSTAKAVNTYDIQALNTTNLEIAYCHVTQSGDYAISIGCVPSPNVVQLPCYNTNFHDNLIENTASDGLHYRGGSAHIIKGNIFNATGDDELGIAGLPWDRISDVTVESNVFENGNVNAIKFTTEQGLVVANVTTDQISGVNIVGNTINTMNQGGIWIWVPQTTSNYTVGTVFCSNVSITNNIIRNTNYPAFVGGWLQGLTGCWLQGLTFSGNTISHCGSNGHGGWQDGSLFYRVINSVISGNTFSRCGAAGYYSIDLQNGTSDIISNNMVVNSNGCGIQDVNGGQNLFAGNDILFSFAHGFAVNNAADDLIQNNYIEGSGQGALGDGLVYTGTNGTIMGNKIIGGGRYQRYALNVHLGSVNTVVSDNDLRNVITTSGVVNDAGIGTIFLNNQGYDAGAHDVATTNVTTSKTGCVPMPTVGQNLTVAVNVTVANFGGNDESTVNVTVYAASSMPPAIVIGSTTVGLDVGENMTMLFTWNTTGLAYGNYTISVTAGPVPGETNTGDNTFTDGTILVTIPGDLNGDFKVSLTDLVILANAYGSKPGDTRWNPNADMNGNSVADLSDLVILANHYGQHYP